MANWVDNVLHIEGKTKDLKRFDEQFRADHVIPVGGTISSTKSTKEELIKDLEAKHKMIEFNYVSKEDVKNDPNTRFPQFASDKVHYLTGMKEVSDQYSYQNFIPMTKEDMLSGFYDWSLDNWGVKWDVRDIQPITNLIDEEDNPEQLTEIEYLFMSPWSPPLPVFQEMVEQYPELTFIYKFREDGNRFAGIFYGENGEITAKEEVGLPEDTDDKYKLFLNKHFGDKLYQCERCSQLMEWWEMEELNKCSVCHSDNVEEYN